MSLLDPYATLDEFRAAVGAAESATDTDLEVSLLGNSRLIEAELGVAPGGFNPHSATYVFDGDGGDRLWLRDRAGLQYFLQSITADSLKIDIDRDGVHEYLLDTDDDWVHGMPENADVQGRPWESIELRDLVSASIRTFPSSRGCVEITGIWGWALVPDPIRQLVIGLTLDLRRARYGGRGVGMSIEGNHALSAETFWMWREAQQICSSRIPAF